MNNNKVKSTSDESLELVALLESKPQIDQKVKYYKGVLETNGELYESLHDRLKKGYTVTKSLIFGFIPVKTKHVLDELDKSRIKMEIQNIDDAVWNIKQYYENWLSRVKEYEFKMDEVSRECSQHFDTVLKKSRDIAGNLRLNDTLKEYDENGAELSQNDKNAMYLYLKQEVNNAEVHKKGR